MSMLAISKSTIATQIVEELRRRIIKGEYRAGMKLQQEQIAQELGVSRSPVREALRQLEAEGLVILISQKGAEVAPISASEVAEMFEIRLQLEPHLLALAIPQMKAADLSEAARLIALMETSDVGNWGMLNWDLHRSLYRPADRPTILRMLERVHQNIDRYLRMEITRYDGRATAKVEHQTLVSLCRAGQVERAVSLLRMHILNATAHLPEMAKPDNGSAS